MATPFVESALSPPALPTAWPGDLAAAVLSRARGMAGSGGRSAPDRPTLELWRPESRRLVRDAAFLATGLARTGEPGEADELGAVAGAGAGDAVVPQPGTFASIVSVAGLVHFADLPLALRGLSYLLQPEGTLHLLEPVSAPGVVAFAGASLASGLRRWIPEVRHLHLHRDLPAALRAEGFTIATIERFAMPATVPPLRPWMVASALHLEPAGGSA